MPARLLRFCRRQTDQRYPHNTEGNHARQFLASDYLQVSLYRHYPRVRNIRPSGHAKAFGRVPHPFVRRGGKGWDTTALRQK